MTDQTKFEEMLEKLVNEDKDGAEALFHEIVVEKSREIYQNILESEDEEVEEDTDEEVDEATDEEVDEATDEEVDEAADEEVEESEDDDLDEMFGLDELEMEAEPEMGGDAADDMMGDIAADMDGDDDEEGEEEADGPEAAMDNLEDALDALKAEFEKMMGDEEPGDEDPEEEAMAFEADDEEVEEAADEEVEEASDEEVEETTDEEVDESAAPKTAGEEMREYVEKVSASMGDNGANTKSTVASPNDMGGTAGNIAQGSADEKGGTGAAAPKEDNAGNRNTKGGMSAKKGTKTEPGHGAEKKGKPDTPANKKPEMGG